jgi:hypothetical protein
MLRDRLARVVASFQAVYVRTCGKRAMNARTAAPYCSRVGRTHGLPGQ